MVTFECKECLWVEDKLPATAMQCPKCKSHNTHLCISSEEVKPQRVVEEIGSGLKPYMLDLGNGELFRKQRRLLLKIIDKKRNPAEVDLLEGLQNLLDEIADQAKDTHHLNTTWTEIEVYDPNIDGPVSVDSSVYEEWQAEVASRDTALGFFDWRRLAGRN